MKVKFNVGDYIVNKVNSKNNLRVWKVKSNDTVGTDMSTKYGLISVHHPCSYFKYGRSYGFGTRFIDPKYDLVKDTSKLLAIML